MCALPLPSRVTLGQLPDPICVSAPPLQIHSISELLQGSLPALSLVLQVLTFIYGILAGTQKVRNVGAHSKLDSSTGQQCPLWAQSSLEALLPQIATAGQMNGRELALEWRHTHTQRGGGEAENPH